MSMCFVDDEWDYCVYTVRLVCLFEGECQVPQGMCQGNHPLLQQVQRVWSLLEKSCCFSWWLDFHVWQKLHGSFSWNDCHRFKKEWWTSWWLCLWATLGHPLGGCSALHNYALLSEFSFILALAWRWSASGRTMCLPSLSSMLALWVSDSSDRHK